MWNMSHCGTSTFDNHFDYRLIVFKTYNIALESEYFVLDGMWSMFVEMTFVCLIGMELCMFGLTIADGFFRISLLGPSVLFGSEQNTSRIKFQRLRAGIPSMRKLASREMISASVELCETASCFLHIQLIGTNVWLPKNTKTLLHVDFESSKALAKSKSWNNPSVHCCAVFLTETNARMTFSERATWANLSTLERPWQERVDNECMWWQPRDRGTQENKVLNM